MTTDGLSSSSSRRASRAGAEADDGSPRRSAPGKAVGRTREALERDAPRRNGSAHHAREPRASGRRLCLARCVEVTRQPPPRRPTRSPRGRARESIGRHRLRDVASARAVRGYCARARETGTCRRAQNPTKPPVPGSKSGASKFPQQIRINDRGASPLENRAI